MPVARFLLDNAIGLILGPSAFGSPGFGPVAANMAPMALVGDAILVHPPAPKVPTCAASVILPGATLGPLYGVYANGRPVARMLDFTTCGHPIMSGSFNVFA